MNLVNQDKIGIFNLPRTLKLAFVVCRKASFYLPRLNPLRNLDLGSKQTILYHREPALQLSSLQSLFIHSADTRSKQFAMPQIRPFESGLSIILYPCQSRKITRFELQAIFAEDRVAYKFQVSQQR